MWKSCRNNFFAEAEACFGLRTVVRETGVVLKDSTAKPYPPFHVAPSWDTVNTLRPLIKWSTPFQFFSGLFCSGWFGRVVIVWELVNLVSWWWGDCVSDWGIGVPPPGVPLGLWWWVGDGLSAPLGWGWVLFGFPHLLSFLCANSCVCGDEPWRWVAYPLT